MAAYTLLSISGQSMPACASTCRAHSCPLSASCSCQKYIAIAKKLSVHYGCRACVYYCNALEHLQNLQSQLAPQRCFCTISPNLWGAPLSPTVKDHTLLHSTFVPRLPPACQTKLNLFASDTAWASAASDVRSVSRLRTLMTMSPGALSMAAATYSMATASPKRWPALRRASSAHTVG